LGQGCPKNSVKAHSNAKLRKWPEKPKGSKWVWDVQEKTNGTQEPASDVTKKSMALLGY